MVKHSFLLLFALFLAISFLGCSKKEDPKTVGTDNNLNIDYPAVYVVNGGSNSISVINASTDEVKATVSLESMMMDGQSMMTNVKYPHHIYMSPDRNWLAVSVPGMDLSAGHSGGMIGMKGKVVIMDAKNCSITKLGDLNAMNHNAIFSNDGKEVWTSSMEEMGKVVIMDASNLRTKETINVGSEPAEITFTPDAKYAFVANGGSNDISIIDINSKKVIKTVPVGSDPVGAWIGKDNRMYVDNESSKTVSVIDVATMNVVETINLGFTPGYVAYNQVKNELWVSNATDGKVVYFMRMDNEWIKDGEIITGTNAHAILFSNDGLKAYVTNQGNGMVSVIDVASHIKKKDLKVGNKPNGMVLR